MLNKKKIFISFLALFIIGVLAYIGRGLYEYNEWQKTKEAVASGGYTNLYAGTFGAVMPGCTITNAGCTCPLCNVCGCQTYSQATITIGQPVNKGAVFLCVNDTVQVKGTPLIAASGKQFISGSLTGQCLTGNAVLATPSLAADRVEKFKNWFANKVSDFIIAGANNN